MKLNLSIKGQRMTLDHSEVNDLLRGLEFALSGGCGQKSFGCVTAHSDGAAAAQGSLGAGGALRFSTHEPINVKVNRILGRPRQPAAHHHADDEDNAASSRILADF